MSASEGDVLCTLSNLPLDSKTDTNTFATLYKTKFLFPVLKEVSDAADEGPVEVIITRRGIMKIEVNGITAYVFPEK